MLPVWQGFSFDSCVSVHEKSFFLGGRAVFWWAWRGKVGTSQTIESIESIHFGPKRSLFANTTQNPWPTKTRSFRFDRYGIPSLTMGGQTELFCCFKNKNRDLIRVSSMISFHGVFLLQPTGANVRWLATKVSSSSLTKTTLPDPFFPVVNNYFTEAQPNKTDHLCR